MALEAEVIQRVGARVPRFRFRNIHRLLNMETCDLIQAPIELVAASKTSMAKSIYGTLILTMVIPVWIKLNLLDQLNSQLFFMNYHYQNGKQDVCEFTNMRISGLLMAPQCKVPVDKAVAVLERFIDHFRTHQLPMWSDNVWKEMSTALQGAWTPNCTYVNVRDDRRNILTTARKNQGVILEDQINDDLENPSEMSYSDQSSKSNTSASCNISLNNHNATIKHLVLTEEEWKDIEPTDGILKLKPNVWSNTVSNALWLQYRMPCAFIFKRAEVRKSPDELSYLIKFCGYCKSAKCGNPIVGTAEKKIDEVSGVTFALQMNDTRAEKHEVVKRPLNGNNRKGVYKSLMSEGCANFRKGRAKKIMLPGDIEPPILPKLNVLRQAKKEGNDKSLGIVKRSGRDIVRSIEELPLNPKYCGLIHEVGGFPFRVLYGSPAQLRVYQEFRRLRRKDFTVSLDATGGLVNKINRSNGTKSSHIFLYAIVINFSGVTASVFQMLSERQDTITIMTWLLRWIQSGAAAPKQSICDYSRAFLMAISMAFNKQPIKEYIDDRFKAITNSCDIAKSPTTLIRLDVAHFIHMVCRWKCFEGIRQRAIKDFYLRCVALMIECRTKPSFERVFILTCAVALQTHEDAIVDISEARTAREARKELENLISQGNIADEFKNHEPNDKQNTPFHLESVEDNDDNPEVDFQSENTSIGQWIDDLTVRAQNVRSPGKNLNAFYFPDFINRFISVAKAFPLWTAAGMPKDTQRASSSYVEGYFNDLKTRVLKQYTLPISVDKFIREHVEDIAGANCIISSSMVQYNNDRLHKSVLEEEGTVQVETSRKVNIEKEMESTESEIVQNVSYIEDVSSNDMNWHDSDLFAYENWRGKGDAPEINYLTEDTESGEPDVEGLIKIPSNQDKVSNTVDLERLPYHTEEYGINNSERSEIYEHKLDHAYCKVNNKQLTSANFVSILEGQVDEKSNKRQAPEEPPKLKPEKSSKYFKPYPEIIQQNALITDKNKTHVKTAAVLPNGSLRGAVLLEGYTYFLRNTCAFDSLVQILAIAGIDDVQYLGMLQNAVNRTLKFVFDFIAQGVTSNIFVERARILRVFCTRKSQAQIEDKPISWELDAMNNVANVVKFTLSSHPSVTDLEDCPTCGKQTKSRALLSPNHNIITRKGFKALEEALQFWNPLYKVQCQNGCSAKYTRTSTVNEHVFIELDVRHSNDIKKSLQCTLDEFPTLIRLKSGSQETHSEYRLAGIIERSPGHYIAHCLRLGGYWQKYNDMDQKVGASGKKTRIEPHLAIYVKKAKQN